MTVRYVLHPGWITSKSDGQYHYITAHRLAELYGVPMRYCTIQWNVEHPNYRPIHEQPDDIHLFPLFDGSYWPQTQWREEISNTQIGT